MEGESLSKLTAEQLEERIKTNLSELLSNPKFTEEFKEKLSKINPPSRKEFTQRILEAVKMNNESVSVSLTTKKGIRLPPTVSNWLKDYLSFTEKEEYVNSPEFKGVEEEEQAALKNLFEFYEILNSDVPVTESTKIPEKEEIPKEPEPRLEPNEELDTVVVKDRSGKLKILRKGEFIDLDIPQAGQAETKEETPEVRMPTPESKPEPEKVVIGESDRLKEEKEKSIAAPSYDDPEDADEIKRHKEELSSYALPEFEGLDNLVQKVITQNNMTFADEVLKKRYESIARSRLKEIRNERDTLDLFTRSTKIGGLGFSEEQGKKILEDLNKEISTLTKLKPKEEKKPEIAPPTPAEAMQKALEEKKVLKPADEIPSVEERQEPEPKPAVQREPIKPEVTQAQALYGKALKNYTKENELKKKREIEEAKKPKLRTSIFGPRPASQKRKVEDIKGKPKVLGPVEELKDLTLHDLRKLGTEKVSSTQKVLDKINLLKEESFPKFAQGIKAWRGSEVYKMYLKMGHQSMEKGKTINEIIQENEGSGEPYLTESEFNAIADLNKKLRF